MIAESLNVGGGVCIIKPAKLCMCTQTHYKHDKDGSMAPGVHGLGFVPLSHSGNAVTRIGLHMLSLCYNILQKRALIRINIKDYKASMPYVWEPQNDTLLIWLQNSVFPSLE